MPPFGLDSKEGDVSSLVVQLKTLVIRISIINFFFFLSKSITFFVLYYSYSFFEDIR
jgi:hypothetical protein